MEGEQLKLIEEDPETAVAVRGGGISPFGVNCTTTIFRTTSGTTSRPRNS